MSRKHLITGARGEDLAAAYLEKNGYQIVARNWRSGRYEIDIIAWQHEKLLVFIEVKTRSSEAFGGPEGAITPKKQNQIIHAAGLYMESIGYEWEIRFDVIAVMQQNDKFKELRHVEDAFFPG